MIRRSFFSTLLLILVGLAATVLHLELDRESWVAQGESPHLWDWTEALLNSHILLAVAQYVAVAGAFALALVLWHSKWRMLRNLLIAWGITWLPVALISTGDVTASSGGPFNFPMSIFAAPIFALICLVELGIAILIRGFRHSRAG